MRRAWAPATATVLLLAAGACGSGSSAGSGAKADAGASADSAGGTGDSATGGDAAGEAGASGSTRTLTAFSASNGTTVSTGFGSNPGTCTGLKQDTSSCQGARTALGLAGNWLAFSCNVLEGLATSSRTATTSMSGATYVTLTMQDLPDYQSNYYPTTGTYDFTANAYTVTGSFDSLYAAFSTYFPDPNTIAAQTVTLYVPIAPQAAASMSQSMAGMNGGIEGMALNGVGIFDSAAGQTDNIFAESGSFDQCGGHPDNMSTYHYHAEPYSISYDDDALVGVMRDGFFIYGRQDSDGSTPGTIAEQQTGGAGATNLIYVYGGHTGTAPSSTDTSSFHYHLTEWKGCFDETTPGNAPPTKLADDGMTYDPTGTFNTPASTTCNGTWVDAWFLTGHGNGGVFAQIPDNLDAQNPAQTVAANRYFYGTPGPCTGCAGM
jgi:YHYH protein